MFRISYYIGLQVIFLDKINHLVGDMLSYQIIDSKIFERAKIKLLIYIHTRKFLYGIPYSWITNSNIQTGQTVSKRKYCRILPVTSTAFMFDTVRLEECSMQT